MPAREIFGYLLRVRGYEHDDGADPPIMDMRSAIKLGMQLMVAVLIGGTAYAAIQHWRPVMPTVIVNVRSADGHIRAPALMIIYGEHGSNPFHGGHLRADQRVSQCQTIGSRCVSTTNRRDFGTINERVESLQIRLFNGKGNPIVGGLRWTGPWHPAQVRVQCDLRVSNVRSSCTTSGVTA